MMLKRFCCVMAKRLERKHIAPSIHCMSRMALLCKAMLYNRYTRQMKANAMAKVIPIRFSDEEHARYEAMAAGAFPKPLPLSTYLKRRLAAGDDMDDAITMLGRAIDDLGRRDAGQSHADASPADTSKMLLEILLLLRAVANPQHVRSVQGELQRLGIGAWQAGESV